MNVTTVPPTIVVPSAVLDLQAQILAYFAVASDYFYRIPGSAIAIRYIRSSYQNDPVRSFIELFLGLFALRYILGSRYAPGKGGRGKEVKLSEEEIDDLIEDWTPEPLVAPQTEWEMNENEKRPVIVG
ncbi:MAG: hypothetical protein INR71_05320 [Terriglobus roseus]|nr:hypothetical protein [Terriglobus roseus]